MVTGAIPLDFKPRALAAAADRSMIRPRFLGPLSFIRTTTERPLRTLVTLTRIQKVKKGGRQYIHVG